jgi:hypothetical protein
MINKNLKLISSFFFIRMFAFLLCPVTIFGQNNQNNDTVKKVHPGADLFKMDEPEDCKSARIFINNKTIVNEMTYLKRNFTDQLLIVCPSRKLYPASRVWGFNQGNKYYRSGHTFDRNFVFAERVIQGKLSLFYCRNIPNHIGEYEVISKDPEVPDYTNRMIIQDPNDMRFKDDFSYFISPASDSSDITWVNNNNIGDIADTYLKSNPVSYKDAMQYVKKNRTLEKLTLIAGVTCYFLGCYSYQTRRIDFFNYRSPFLYFSLGSIASYIYIRVKNKHRYLSPNNMIRIVAEFNGQVVKE